MQENKNESTIFENQDENIENEINDKFSNIKELVINSRNKVYMTVNTIYIGILEKQLWKYKKEMKEHHTAKPYLKNYHKN